MTTINKLHEELNKEEAKKEQLIESIRIAVDAENGTRNKWKMAGLAVREWYTAGLDAWISQKKILMAELITPALPEATQTAIKRELPRKGTPAAQFYGAVKTVEERDLMTVGELKVELAQCLELLELHLLEKKRAKAHEDSMFRKVTEYAYSDELEAKKQKGKGKGNKGEGEGEGEGGEIDSAKLTTNKAKLMADASNWIKRLQKSEGEDFNINDAIAALNSVIAVLTK